MDDNIPNNAKITSRPQLHKMLMAFNAFTSNTAPQVSIHIPKLGSESKSVKVEMAATYRHANFSGMVEGQITERFEQRGGISFSDINEIMLSMERRIKLTAPGEINQINRFLATCGQSLEDAFEIAIHNRPIPTAEAEKTIRKL